MGKLTFRIISDFNQIIRPKNPLRIAKTNRCQSCDDEGRDCHGGRGVDEWKPTVADELRGADRGEAHQREDGQGAPQPGKKESYYGGREVLLDVVGGGICNPSLDKTPLLI